MKLLLDTNITLDFLARRDPFFEPAAKLMVLGYVNETELLISFSQLTDIHYVLTHGANKVDEQVARIRMKKLRAMVGVVSLGATEADSAIDLGWNDFEDTCVYLAAQKAKVDAIITRNKKDFRNSPIKVMTADELFEYLEAEKGFTFELTKF